MTTLNRSRLFLAALLFASRAFAGPVPKELSDVLAAFKSEGTRGWSYTQTTVSENKGLVERYDASKPEYQRWSLLEKDHHAPTESELKDYAEILSRRTKGEAAPNVKDQIQPDTCTLVSENEQEAVYRFRLKPGGNDDQSAEHLQVSFTLDKPTRTIRHVVLESFEAFSPMFSVKIQQVRTTIDYTLPTADEPTHLLKITVMVRGRAMLLKSLDQDMTVTYTDFAPAFPQKKTLAPK